jgi:hypothetical protein
MHRLLLSALSLVFLLTACDTVHRDTEAEQKIKAEQKLIQAYSKGVPAADLQQTQFVRAWEEANEIKSLKKFKEAMEQRVVPGLSDYVSALGRMPTGTADLKRIHGAVIASYTEAIIAFSIFIDGLNEENVEARYQDLLVAMDKVGADEKKYHAQLREYYARSRVRLVEAANP